MTNATATPIYDIRVTTPNEDGTETVIVYGGGNLKVLAYLANSAVKTLGDAADGTEASVSVKTADGGKVLSFTGDADTAAMALKGKVSKLRKAAGDTDTAE